MPDNDNANLNADDGDAAAAAAKAKADKDKQGDDEVVPKRQFLAALKSANEKFDALQAQFNELKAGSKKVDAPRQYTRAELGAAVVAGQITQEAADQVWDDQIVTRATTQAVAAATQSSTQAQRKERVDSDISRYTRLEPDILIEGSDVREKVAAEYKFLVGLGDPPTTETELKAIRAALGPVDRLEIAKSGRDVHDTHRETGGAGGGGGRKPKTFADTLTPREKKNVEKMIDMGQYKDWKDAEETYAQYANPETRRKHGAAA